MTNQVALIHIMNICYDFKDKLQVHPLNEDYQQKIKALELATNLLAIEARKDFLLGKN